jgi:hypothetical protein
MNKASINYRQEARNLFDRARGVPDIMQCLQKINDPPTLNKVVEELKKYWHRQERACHELTGYSNGDGQWIPTWPTIDEDLNNIIELVSESSDTPCETPTTSYQPTKRTTKKPTTMPKKTAINITNHFYGSIGQHIDHIDSQYVNFDKDMNMQIRQVNQQHLHTTPEPSPTLDIEKFRALLTVPYLNRKRECEAMIELITREGYNKKDRARMALALYQSGNVALKREHITTFRQWWRICCELLHWEGASVCYRTAELTPNELTKQILSYM